ncbi:adenylate/guanylate cyclase domain-containing protein [[Mycobacterium] wendilense]|uniref:Adenylate/guanylate cyclase domain-containing protein n=2 Tax=[Mycobacterium] wendilense TaxID=3064284 RepID=A0ABM9MDM3_9MYCO|nr:adenylate/guanylate cyclase domain-containing protein [Mycolicibacterium sp. MU0050]CAJ1582677.1 adenylate/guanylate cyclase domain-containing protein [Mycolicibacterium sp. MU0050]
MSIQSKLLVMLLVTSVVSAAVVGFIGYESGRSSLREAAFDRLIEIRERSTRLTETQAQELTDSLVIYTRGASTVNAMRDFKRAFAELNGEDVTVTPAQQRAIETYYETKFKPRADSITGQDLDVDGLLPTSQAQRYLQAVYTAPYDIENYSIDVSDAGDGSAWSATSARYHDFFREIVTRFEYDDALLIDLDGTVVYSAYRGVDLGTNILDGPYRDAKLTDAFDKVITSHNVDFVMVTDFDQYLPSYNEPVAWLMSPIGEAGRIEGVLALQFPIEKLNATMTANRQWEAVGMGETGEVFLVGPDDLMRTDSRLFLQDPEEYKRLVIANGTPAHVADRAIEAGGTTLIQPVTGEAFERARRGESGTLVQRDYLGHETLMAYGPVDMPGVQWSIVATVDTDEAFAPVQRFTRNLVLSTVGIIFLVCLASMWLARMFVQPIRRLEAGAQRISAGDLDTTLPVTSHDEFGDLTVSFNDMSRNLRVKEELINQQRKENDQLLLSLMPAKVVDRYREGDEVVAQDHQDVTVIFADIVGLDELSTQLDSEDLLAAVNQLFRQFDAAAENIGVERVRTMRNGYLASCGLNVPRLDNIGRTLDFAVEMQRIIDRFNAQTGHRLALRAGIDTGAVTSGLVGRTHVIYDMWGAAVNLAYQAQSGPTQPGIYVTSAVYDVMRDTRQFKEAGEINGDTAKGGAGATIWRLAESS